MILLDTEKWQHPRIMFNIALTSTKSEPGGTCNPEDEFNRPLHMFLLFCKTIKKGVRESRMATVKQQCRVALWSLWEGSFAASVLPIWRDVFYTTDMFLHLRIIFSPSSHRFHRCSIIGLYLVLGKGRNCGRPAIVAQPLTSAEKP